MNTHDRIRILKNWTDASSSDKAKFFASLRGGDEMPPEVPSAYTACMDKCADKHMRLIKKCGTLTGAALEACAKGVEEQMADCYQRCNDML